MVGNSWYQPGSDTLDGGAGDDQMTGSSGTIYLVGKGDGQDSIWQSEDAPGNNTLQFKAGVASSEVTLAISGEDLIIGYRTTLDQIVAYNFYADGSSTNSANPVQQFKFADGTVWSLATIDARVHQTNHAPTLVSPVADRAVAQGAPFSFAISATAFSDNDPGDVLSYAATLADGSPLPNWLVFDPASRVFSGAAPASGTTSIRVVASDGVLQASDDFEIVATLQNLTLTGTAAADTLRGGAGNDSLNGAGANDSLIGGAGNDTLDGGTGNDTMLGGTGDDTYIVNVATDVVTELANEGIDTVQSSATLTIAANVENLTLTGSSTISGTGNGLDNLLKGNSANNTLTGGAGNDTLDGGSGNDTMLGGTGNDTFVVNVSTDVVTENASEGTDTIQSAVTLTLGNNVENLTLTGSNAINATGNTLANTLLGNSGANVLTGAAGDDIYDGGAGNDTFNDSVTTSNDTYLWGIGSGMDTLTDAGGSLDHIDLYAGVAKSQLKFVKNANNLELSILGQTDKLTIKNWYVGSANQIEEFRLSDGSKVLASQVNGLVSAMAAFVPMDSTINETKTRFIDMPISNPQGPPHAWM